MSNQINYFVKTQIYDYIQNNNQFSSYFIPTNILSIDKNIQKNAKWILNKEQIKDAKSQFIATLQTKSPFSTWLAKSFINPSITFEDLIKQTNHLPEDLLEEFKYPTSNKKEFYWPTKQLVIALFKGIDKYCYKNQVLLKKEIAEHMEWFFVEKYQKTKTLRKKFN